MNQPTRYAVPAVEGALTVLETLAGAPQLGVSELAKRLGLSKGSVYRLLATLVRRGYVEKDAQSDRYQLTYRLFAVGSRAAQRLGLREVAQPVMERLGSETGETVNLGVLDDFRTVSLHLVESTHPLSIHMRIGGLPAHATATGKILLAALDPAEFARRLGGRRLERITERTLKSRPALLADLARVRTQGFAVDDEECSLGMRCVGAPIRDHRGMVVAALSVVAPCQRLPSSALPATIELVRDAAREISHRLGWPVETAERGGDGSPGLSPRFVSWQGAARRESGERPRARRRGCGRDGTHRARERGR
jgi:DNA-binding IclR family transcriptional regulator